MFEDRIAQMNQETAAARPTYINEKRTYTVDEIQDILGISRPTAYNLVKKDIHCKQHIICDTIQV